MALGGNTLGLIFKIGTSGTDKTDAEIKALRKSFQKEVAEIKHSGTDAFRSLGSSVGLSTKEMAALSVAAPIAGAALAATAAAAIGAGVAVFELARSFSDAGSKIHDTAQQMGVGAEMASVLKYAAEQSGKSFESLSAPIAKFSRLVGEAARGSEQASEKLQRFGIDPQKAINDLDGTLAKVFKKIHDAPDGIAKATLASDAFGSKIGTALIPVIETMNGDLATFSKEAEAAGVVMSQADADAADKFGDTLGKLQTQLQFTTYVFAAQFAPVIEKGMQNLSTSISKNKETIKAWGTSFADVMRGAVAASQTSTASILADWSRLVLRFATPVNLIVYYGVKALASKGAEVRAGEDIVGGSDATIRKPDADMGDIFSKGAGAGKAVKDELAPFKAILDQVNRSMDFFGEKTERAKVEQQFLAHGIDKLNPSLRQHAELIRSAALAQADVVDAMRAVEKQTQANIEADKKHEAVLDDVDQAMFKQKQTLSDLQTRYPAWLRAVNDFIVAKHREGFEWDAATEAIYRNVAAQIEQQRVMAEGLTRARSFEQDKAEKNRGATRPRTVTPGIDPDGFKAFGDAIKTHLGGDKLTAATAGLQTMAMAFQGVGQAVGEAVSAFVLFGNAGVGLRQFTAELIANIAQMAAVQAIWELAQGFAMLAMNFFWPDPRLTAAATMHFHAAAIYGGLAAIAAGAGRAIAGNSFSAGASGGGGGGGNASTSNANENNSPAGINIGRRTGAGGQAPIVINLHGDAAQFDFKAVRAVHNDYKRNGPTRQLLLSDGVLIPS